MSNAFYRAFEDRHRGSRELIKSRLTAYLPFLVPLAAARMPAALDLGCGRGEWLELLGESGFAARGVDLDEGMLAACRERSLQVETQDALSSLRAQPDASLSLVSAFHLVEHIPFDAVQELIKEALRVLAPGGLLILETPNPENLVVATSGFYMDPSHLRPIPPQLLEFVVEFGGFARHRVVRLQEPPQLHGAAKLDLMNVLNGASPDYSIVAQKSADLAVTAAFDAAFAAPYGLDLSTLAQRYQSQQDARHGEVQSSLAQLAERIAAAEVNAGGLFQRTLETISEAQAATRLIQAELHSAQQRERALEAATHAQALQNAEARAAGYLNQAQEAGARALHAEQRAREAEQAAAEQAALAERHAAEVQQLLDKQTHRAEALASQLLEEAERKHAEFTQQATTRLRQAEQQLEKSQRHADNTEKAHAAAERHAQYLQAKLDETNARLQAAEQRVHDILASSSWRITRPARAAMLLLRDPKAFGSRLRARGSSPDPAPAPAARAPANLSEPQAPRRQAGQLPPPSAPTMSRSAQNVLAQLQRRLHIDDNTEN